VDEWCSDGRREYDGALQVDPRGPTGDAPRAVRGGSWLDHPHGLRAACRLVRPHVRRGDFQGFRFSLRSTSGPEGSAERPPEAAVTRDA